MMSYRSWLSLLRPQPRSSHGVMLLAESPLEAFPVVIIMTPVSVLLVIDWIRNCCRIEHHLEPLDMCVYLFVIFGGDGE
jgi:hypothetical protein